MRDLPATATLVASAELADALYRSVSRLPAYSHGELCSTTLQAELRAHVRAGAPSEFDALRQGIEARLAVPPYVAYVTGMRFDVHDLLLIALSSLTGDVVDPYHRAGAGLVRRLSPPRDRLVPGVGVVSEALHTDGTDAPEPNDVTCLLCVHPDQNGDGRTRLLDMETVEATVLSALGGECVEVLTTEPVPWRIAVKLGGGTVEAPVVTDRRLRWLRDAVANPVPGRVDSALAAFESVLAKASEGIEFAMSGGALLIVNNKRTLHARTSIADRASSQRLVLRTKVYRRPR
jgi:hypothetical protein